MANLKKIGISVNTFDPDGTIVLDLSELPRFAGRTRRTSVTQTLDGGVVANDGGFSHGDRTFTFNSRPTSAEADTLAHIFDTYGQVFVSTEEGFYLCSPRAMVAVQSDEFSLIFLVIEKLA